MSQNDPSPLLRLDKLRVENFRCFAECDLELHPELTVLVAGNGGGKTALLDACTLALGSAVDAITGNRAFAGFDRADVRRDTPTPPGPAASVIPVALRADGYLAGAPVSWSKQGKLNAAQASARLRVTSSGLKCLQFPGQQLRGPSALLPLLALYKTDRLWGAHKMTQSRRLSLDADERLVGYDDLASNRSSFESVKVWYRSRMDELGKPAFKADSDATLQRLEAIRTAVNEALDPVGWSGLEWDPQSGRLTLNHNEHGRFPVEQLSDGIRTMAALVMDIARRCATLNPDLRERAALDTEGVLLIDEIDMHLHPSWQQRVVGLLRRAFPRLQMILTTHSDRVLTTVEGESVRLVSRTDIRSAGDYETRGATNSGVLLNIMGVEPEPDLPETQMLNEYRRLIDAGEFESPRAAELKAELEGHFGPYHPQMVNAEASRRLAEFARRQQAERNS